MTWLAMFHQKNASNRAELTVLLLTSTFLLGGCATTTTQNAASQSVNQSVDPYENMNRKVYNFNDKVDDYVAKPVSDAYKFITPDFVQTGVHNFFNNLKDINVVLNDVLQGKFEQGAQDTGRFLMNSTLGMAGLFDVAKTVGMAQNDEDFEQTLAVWGVPQGNYLVLPFLGPITFRGIPGAVVDTAANPVTYVGAPVQVISLINSRANAEGSLKFIDEAALDPYVFTRESFLQWRNHLASDGKSESSTDILDPELDAVTPESNSKVNSSQSSSSQNQISSDQGGKAKGDMASQLPSDSPTTKDK